MHHQNHHYHNFKEVASRKSEGTGASGESVEPEALNKKALDIVQRVRICAHVGQDNYFFTQVRDKLTGKDFNKEESLKAKEQVWCLAQLGQSNPKDHSLLTI